MQIWLKSNKEYKSKTDQWLDPEAQHIPEEKAGIKAIKIDSKGRRYGDTIEKYFIEAKSGTPIEEALKLAGMDFLKKAGDKTRHWACTYLIDITWGKHEEKYGFIITTGDPYLD